LIINNCTLRLAWNVKISVTIVEKRVARGDRRGIRLDNPYLIDLCLVIERHDRESGINWSAAAKGLYSE